MLAVKGIYENGDIKLIENININTKQQVIVTFLDEEDKNNLKKIDFKTFNFLKAQKKLENYKGEFCDALIEERREEL